MSDLSELLLALINAVFTIGLLRFFINIFFKKKDDIKVLILMTSLTTAWQCIGTYIQNTSLNIIINSAIIIYMFYFYIMVIHFQK